MKSIILPKTLQPISCHTAMEINIIGKKKQDKENVLLFYFNLS
jgi:hypothetical protein